MLVEENSRELKAMAHGMNTEIDYDTTTEGGYSNSKPDEEEVRRLVEFMGNEINKAPSSPANYTIYRILKPLREVKPEAYTPRLVSIGPFHRQSIHLWPMEAHKLRLLKYFLNRSYPNSLDDFVRELMNLEEAARQCYSEIIPFNKEEFVRMMVVDGCFLLELILGWTELDDPIFNESWMPQIVRDILLLENQLPFFVLQRLFLLYMGYSSHPREIYNVTEAFLHDFLPHSPRIIHKPPLPQRFCNWVKSIFRSPLELKKDELELPEESSSNQGELPEEHPSNQGESPEEVPEFEEISFPLELRPQVPEVGERHLLDYVRHLYVSEPSREHKVKKQYSQQTYCATELKKATVRFKKSKTRQFSDITFMDGVLRLPAIHIDDLTESLLRNLIALEQYHQNHDKYVTGYAVFMDDLIKSPEDVEVLQAEEILESVLHAEEVVALFNRLLKEVTEPQYLCFDHVYNELELFYISPWHKFVAKVKQQIGSLRRKYFKNPWSFVSFLAATALLGMTIAQTIAAFMYNSKSGYS